MQWYVWTHHGNTSKQKAAFGRLMKCNYRALIWHFAHFIVVGLIHLSHLYAHVDMVACVNRRALHYIVRLLVKHWHILVHNRFSLWVAPIDPHEFTVLYDSESLLFQVASHLQKRV